MESTDFEKTIKFALEKEKEAVEFYAYCAEKTTRSGMKKAFQEMAEEEMKHVRMLENFSPERITTLRLQDVPNLKVSDYIVDTEFDPGMGYKELLILAMKREESAHALYSQLAHEDGDPSIVKLFEVLAQEELKHKNKLEKEYDDMLSQGN